MSSEKESAKDEVVNAVELSPPDMYVEKECADADGTSPSSMVRTRNENENVNLDEDLEKGGTVNTSIVLNTTIEIASAENVNLEEDLEKRGTVNESIVNTTIEIASDEHHHESQNLSRCRICHSFRFNDEIMEIMDLGCDCKSGLSRAHKVCAENWFQQKGNRRCEICRRLANNIPNPVPNSRDAVDLESRDAVNLDSDSHLELLAWGVWLRSRVIALVLCWVAIDICVYRVHPGFLDSTWGLLFLFFSIIVLVLAIGNVFMIWVAICCKPSQRGSDGQG